MIRAALVLDATNAPLLGDEAAVVRIAGVWRDFGVYVGQWAPGYIFAYERLDTLVGDHAPAAMRIVNATCSVATVGLAMALARDIGRRAAGDAAGLRAAIAAGWVGALHLGQAVWSPLLYSEAPFCALFLASAALALRAARRVDETLPLVLAGALAGLACTFRAAGLIVFSGLAAGVFAAALVARRGPPRSVRCLRGARAALLLAVPAMLVQLPIALERARETAGSGWVSPTGPGNVLLGWSGAPVPFETAGLDPEAIAAAPLGTLRRALERGGPERVTPAEVELAGGTARWSWTELPARIAQHPGWALRSRVLEASNLLTPHSFLHRSLRLGQFDSLTSHSNTRRFVALATVVGTLALFALAWVGLWRVADRTWWCLFAGVALAHAVIPLLLFGLSRFRAPFDALLVVAAGLAFIRSEDASDFGWRRSAALVAAPVGLLLLAPSVPVVWAACAAVW